MRRIATLIALAAATPARAQANLPGTDAAPPLDIAAQNRAAQALRTQYARDRAAYEQALRDHAARNDPAAYRATLESYRATVAAAPATAVVAAAPADPGIAVTGTRGRVCYTVGGRPDTGSLIARTPPRRRCVDSKEEKRLIADSRAAVDRDARELIRAKDGARLQLPGIQ